MTSELWTSNVLVNTWFVWNKIFINSEGSFDWSVGKDFILNFNFIVWNWVRIRSSDFIWVIFFSRFSVACFNTWWSWLWGTTWLILTSSVVITWSKWVSSAPFGISKKTSCNKTLILEEFPSSWRVTTITSITARLTTTS